MISITPLVSIPDFIPIDENMGHQIAFYLSHLDTVNLEENLRKVDDSLLLSHRSRGLFPQVSGSIDLMEDGKRSLFFYMVRTSDVAAVVTREITTQGHWIIDELRSPVVELTCCGYDGEVLRRGRLYYNESFYDENDQLVAKSPAFTNWASKLMAKTRRSLKYDKSLMAYVGEEANEMRKNGISLRQF